MTAELNQDLAPNHPPRFVIALAVSAVITGYVVDEILVKNLSRVAGFFLTPLLIREDTLEGRQIGDKSTQYHYNLLRTGRWNPSDQKKAITNAAYARACNGESRPNFFERFDRHIQAKLEMN